MQLQLALLGKRTPPLQLPPLPPTLLLQFNYYRYYHHYHMLLLLPHAGRPGCGKCECIRFWAHAQIHFCECPGCGKCKCIKFCAHGQIHFCECFTCVHSWIWGSALGYNYLLLQLFSVVGNNYVKHKTTANNATKNKNNCDKKPTTATTVTKNKQRLFKQQATPVNNKQARHENRCLTRPLGPVG